MKIKGNEEKFLW